MGKLIAGLLCLFLCLLLRPENALAWGPGFHLFLGNSLLSQLELLSIPCAEVLSSNWRSFLYGCLSADILVGKGKKLTPTHCHSWYAGFNLLHSSRENQLLAYSYGYLAHLAADVVAHNYYVPNELQLGGGKGKLSHVYIEMQADRKMPFSRHQLRNIMKSPPVNADQSLITILQKSKMTFSLKKKIFKGTLALSRVRHWNNYLKFAEANFPRQDSGEYLHHMRELSFKVMVDCLNNLDNSIIVDYDPMGFENLNTVKKVKSKYRAYPENQANNAMFFLPAMSLLSLIP